MPCPVTERFMTLIASGQAPSRVLDEIHHREERIKTLSSELKRLKGNAPADFNHRRALKLLREGAQNFQELMHSDTTKARKALRKAS